ncbi:ATP-binding protein [Nostoc sp.]|uniref:ATP-binding protein n=1 Tax=Nostoc sp. TaxID=1180 RepID=UPI003FA58ED1
MRISTTAKSKTPQRISIIVSNAICYTEKGCVTIESHSLISNQWAITVNDTGIGIAPGLEERIFDPFAGAEHSNKLHPPDRTGLKLAMAYPPAVGDRIFFSYFY